MRKYFLLLIIAGMAVAGGAYLYLAPSDTEKVSMEAVLPADTVGFVRIPELSQQVERFKADRLGKSLAKMDVPAIMDLMELSRDEQENILQFKEQFQAAVESTWFDILFGQDVALAIQPISVDFKGNEEFDLQQLFQAVTILGKPKQPTRVLESLNSMFSTQLNVRTQAYKDWTINEFRLENGQPAYYALVEGLLIAGMSPEPVQRCLDQSLDPASSLQQSKLWKLHGADLYKAGETDLLFFADLDYILDTSQKALSTQVEERPDLLVLKKQFDDLRALETISLASYDDGTSLLESKVVVSFDPNRMSPTLEQAFGTKPQDNPTIKYVPAGALVYSWQNNFDLNFYWRELLKSPELGSEDLDEIRREFAAFAGVELEQFLAAFGSQLAFLVNDVNTGGMFPVPELALHFEIKDPAILEQAVQNLVGQSGMPLQKESYNGVDILSVSLPLGANLSPAYACDKGFCTLAVNGQLLKSMLDSPQGSSLSSQANFKIVDHGITGKNNQISYLNIEAMIVKARDIVSWSLAWATATQPDKGEKARRLAALVIDPLLDGFSMYKAVGIRSYVEQGRVTTEAYTAVQRP